MTEFDGLHKYLKDTFRQAFPKKEFPFKKNFDGVHNRISNRSLFNYYIILPYHFIKIT